MDIENIIKLTKENKIKWRGHMLVRMQQRKIYVKDIKTCILNGIIIEDYPDDYPYPSCLILGYKDTKIPIHIVCALGQGYVWLITAYFPDINKWSTDFKLRRGE
jgi:hypothetical protein